MPITAAVDECPHIPGADPDWCHVCINGPQTRKEPAPEAVTKEAIYYTEACKSCGQ